VTTVHALVGSDQDPSNRDGELLLEESSQLPVDVVPYLQVRDVRRVKELGLNRVGGCLLLDGSIGSHTAALADPFADDPGNRGLLYFRDEILQEFISSANEAAMQTAVHAIGDRALEQILRVHERCASPASSRHRVEHAELPGPSQIDRALALGLLFGMQPAFEHFWGGPEGMYRQHLGPERASRTNPLRTLAERGMPIAGGSDAPITPVSPMLGIHAAVNHPAECERLELSAAVEMFTTNGAYFSFDEAWKGKLAPGYRADLVLLDQDPFWVPASRLKDVAVLAVWSRGVLRFDRGGLWKQTQG
jgi:predicted amidohydrolase YtcJ